MRVLLATDGSEHALAACRSLVPMLLADRDEVRVLTVLSYTMYPHSLIEIPLSGEKESEESAHQEVRRLTDECRRILEESGLKVDVVHRFGNPPDEIIAEIDEWNPDLVALGRRGVRGVERWIGSVSEHVLHHAKVPMLLVQ